MKYFATIVALLLLAAPTLSFAFIVESPTIFRHSKIAHTYAGIGVPETAGRRFRGRLKFASVDEVCQLAYGSLQVNRSKLPHDGEVLLTLYGGCSLQSKMFYAEKTGALGVVVASVPYEEIAPMGLDQSIEPVHIPAVSVEHDVFVAFNSTMERAQTVVVSLCHSLNNLRYV